MTLLIMAAGMSSRYGELKQFEKLGPSNEYLFEFSIFDAFENGFDHIVVVTNEKYVNELKLYLQKKLPKKIKIDVIAQQILDLPIVKSKVIKREKPWGTAHAVWTVRNLIDDDFVIMNADDFYGYDAFRLAAIFIRNNYDYRMFGLISYSLKETLSDYGTVSRGVCKVDGNLLQSIYEYKEIGIENGLIIDQKTNKKFSGDEPVSMNLWICNPYFFDEIKLQLTNFITGDAYDEKEEIYVPLIIQKMIKDNKIQVKINHTSSKWFGMTYTKDKIEVVEKLHKLSTNGLYPSPLWRN